jgi:hypothetical protein
LLRVENIFIKLYDCSKYKFEKKNFTSIPSSFSRKAAVINCKYLQNYPNNNIILFIVVHYHLKNFFFLNTYFLFFSHIFFGRLNLNVAWMNLLSFSLLGLQLPLIRQQELHMLLVCFFFCCCFFSFFVLLLLIKFFHMFIIFFIVCILGAIC